ncbi:Crp/Fnr family transcriptional regulator [Bacillus shivajii]|uniref:Crp/Fnr family transcriptional regulator n=1 Tax=Bacillus shivajii TaxID=1983719 RepID=UPI001CFA5086|nr:Crp/Fnr family transcriptional regulator [Bacillus shivajii]UCZ54733.1 Crp/Fnr family transcriptional regulator [Bacillus shivajii]
MRQWEKHLSETTVFEGFTQSEIEQLMDLCHEKELKDKEVLFLEGETRKYIYLLGKGTILISKLTETGEESLINVLGEGEMFPHTGFFDNAPYPGTATAKKDVTVLCIPVRAFEQLILDQPELSIKIIKVMNEKIHYLQKKLNEILSLNVESRLKGAMAHLQETQGNTVRLTHQEIGNIIGATRETVSRQLKKWEKEEYVEIKKDRIILHIDMMEI